MRMIPDQKDPMALSGSKVIQSLSQMLFVLQLYKSTGNTLMQRFQLKTFVYIKNKQEMY